jgi:hypothetical protein
MDPDHDNRSREDDGNETMTGEDGKRTEKKTMTRG